MVILSRLHITGYIHERTPWIVLCEIAEAHGIAVDELNMDDPIYVHELVTKIYNTPVYAIEFPCTEPHFVNYINADPTLTWTPSELEAALVFIERYSDTEDKIGSYEIPTPIIIGKQRPESLQSCNACIMYRLIRYHNLDIPWNITLEQMGEVLALCNYDYRRLISTINTILNSTSQMEVLQMLAGYPELLRIPIATSKCPIINHDVIYQTYQRLGVPNDPITHEEAVITAAVKYKLNISTSKNPLGEYLAYTADPEHYVPLDPALREQVVLVPHLLDLTKMFWPMFPSELYTKEDLVSLAIQEGFSRHKIQTNSPYELLQTNYVSHNFYLGRYSNIENKETPFLYEEVNKLPPKLTLCYGILECTLIAFTLEEIIRLLQNSTSFDLSPPIGVLKSRTRRKLCRICRESQDPIFEKLLREIEMLESLLALQSEALTRLLNYPHKEQVEEALFALLHLGMTLRGWDGISEYPVTSAPVENQKEVERRSNESIEAFIQKCQSLEPGLIENLAIIRYETSRSRWINPSNRDGRTIGERLNIVRQGENSAGAESCIRLSSNWFISTAYRYLRAIKKEPGFDINQLSTVS